MRLTHAAAESQGVRHKAFSVVVFPRADRFPSTPAYIKDVGNQDVRTEGTGHATMLAGQLGHQHEFDSLCNVAMCKTQIQSGPEQYYVAWHTRGSPGWGPGTERADGAAVPFPGWRHPRPR